MNMEVRKCCHCGVLKPLFEFCKHPKSVSGYGGPCKPCRSARYKLYEAKRAERIKQERALEVEKLNAEKLVQDNTIELTPPKTFFYCKESYKTPNAYYRNDGLKHIKSKTYYS